MEYTSETDERAVISGCLIDAVTALPLCSEHQLRQEHFRNPILGELYALLCEMGEKHGLNRIDLSTFSSYVQSNSGLVDRLGGVVFLSRLIDDLRTIAHLEYHILRVLDSGIRKLGKAIC